MRKWKNLVFLVGLLFLGFVNLASASIFIDFEPLAFTPEGTAGDYSHTLTTSYGLITYNGRIWDEIGGTAYADHTTATTDGYFLKNTGAKNLVTMTFSFDVDSFELYWLGISGSAMHGAVYDIGGNVIGSESSTGDGTWEFVSDDPSAAIRSIAFWTGSDPLNNNKGNKMAIDDVRINPVVPEPASMSLLGLGLLGLARLRRKKA